MVEFMAEPPKIKIDLGGKNRELMNASHAWLPKVISTPGLVADLLMCEIHIFTLRPESMGFLLIQ
jgi:hypothetical protein